MKTLKESINSSLINEASEKYELCYLTFDEDQYNSDSDEGIASYMYESDDVKPTKFTAPSDEKALEKAQKLLDKQDANKIIAATLYWGDHKSGDTLETLFHSDFDTSKYNM